MSMRSRGAILAIAVTTTTLGLSAAVAKDIHEPGEFPLETLNKVEHGLQYIGSPTMIRTDAFVYDLAKDDFDLRGYLKRHAPHLVAHEEALSHWSGFASIHPRVALALMETSSQILSRPSAPALHRPFGSLSQAVGFDEQMADVLPRLSQRFYNLLELQNNKEAPLFGDGALDSPAALVLASALAESAPTQGADLLAQFTSSYAGLFPDAAEALTAHHSDNKTSELNEQWSQALNNEVPPANMLQMPWRRGFSWIPNGAHAHSGSGFPLSSIDVSYDWPRWNAATYSVAAAHEGNVRVLSRCQVRVSHPNGWATNYYHLSGIEVRDGQSVQRDTKLANYASDRDTALCQGGASSGPHLHFSLLYNGQYRSLQGVNLGTYRINTGRWSYDNHCSYFWLYDEIQQRNRCAWNSIYNHGPRS